MKPNLLIREIRKKGGDIADYVAKEIREGYNSLIPEEIEGRDNPVLRSRLVKGIGGKSDYTKRGIEVVSQSEGKLKETRKDILHSAGVD